MKHNSTFGLLCKEILDEFIDLKGAYDTYRCLLFSEHKLARAASSRIPANIHKIDLKDKKSYIICVDDFRDDQPYSIYIRNFHIDGRTKLKAWDTKYPEINQLTHQHIIDCLKKWIEWDSISDKKTLIFKRRDIVDLYDLTPSQIRNWSKDERKPFIQQLKGRQGYEIDPSHPELKALKK